MRFWVYIPPNNRNVPPMSLLKMSCKTANFLLLEGRYITGAEHKEKPANPDKSRVYELLRSGAGGGTRTHTPLRITDFELFASHRIQTNSTPYGGRRRPPKSPQLLTILKLMCKKAPFRLPFPHFSILTGILDFGGTSEGCDPQTEHNSTRNRFINRKHIIAYFSAIDNILSEKEVSL